MGKQYFCDYCNKSFADNLASRKKHIKSTMHTKLKKLHYDSFRDPRLILSEELAKHPCHSYMSTGVCRFGDTCYYSHLDTRRRRELQQRIDQEMYRYQEMKKEEVAPTLEGWLAKQSNKSDPDDQQKLEVVTAVEHDIPPCLIGLPSIPVSMLPIPPGGCDHIPKLDWG